MNIRNPHHMDRAELGDEWDTLNVERVRLCHELSVLRALV